MGRSRTTPLERMAVSRVFSQRSSSDVASSEGGDRKEGYRFGEQQRQRGVREIDE